ncbi:MAG: type II secretion system protein [Phycisphaerales bacterium]|nr:MAG: type II secretion system protein [Phycisphaerales bacterium]
MAQRDFSPRRRRVSPVCRAITYLEVLVVISVVMLLFAMLIPSLNEAREYARRVQCNNHLRSWGMTVQFYRDDHYDYLPTEGTYIQDGIYKPNTWYNELPPYLDAPAYKDVEGVGKSIEEFPNLHVWICPSKTLTPSYKSGSGKNQFHYGMNQVLDGLTSKLEGSKDAPGFYDGYYYGSPDNGSLPLPARLFKQPATTIFMFDISENSPCGSQRHIATMYQRWWDGAPLGRFHGDYSTILFLDGSVGNCSTDNLVTDRDHRYGDMIWDHPRLYWGYRPPPEETDGEQEP